LVSKSRIIASDVEIGRFTFPADLTNVIGKVDGGPGMAA
jgi:hypothetical protein